MERKFGVTCTVIYNGYETVEAESEEEAMEKVRSMMDSEGWHGAPDLPIGDVNFTFGEATVDDAEELDN